MHDVHPRIEAGAVRQRGPARIEGVDEDGYVVEELKNDIMWLGHSWIAIRSDNEPAIVQVLKEVLKSLKVTSIDQAMHPIICNSYFIHFLISINPFHPCHIL